MLTNPRDVVGSILLRYILCSVMQNFPLVAISTGVSGRSGSPKVLPFNRLRFLLVSYNNFSGKLAVSEKTCCRLWKMPWPWYPVRGHSRSLKMTPFDVPSKIIYCRSYSSYGYLSLVVFDLWFRKYCDLEIQIRVTRGHRSCMIPFNRLSVLPIISDKQSNGRRVVVSTSPRLDRDVESTLDLWSVYCK